MSTRGEQLTAEGSIAEGAYDRDEIVAHLAAETAFYRFRPGDRDRMRRMIAATCDVLDDLPGHLMADRWDRFETEVWPSWRPGEAGRPGGERWTWGAWAFVTSRLVRPSWTSSTRPTPGNGSPAYRLTTL